MKTQFALFALAVALLFAIPAFAEETQTCNASLNEGGKDYALEGVSVFEGPPEEHADLVPDFNGWNLQDYRLQNHELYLVCRYKGTKKTTQYLLPRTMTTCTLQRGNNALCR